MRLVILIITSIILLVFVYYDSFTSTDNPVRQASAVVAAFEGTGVSKKPAEDTMITSGNPYGDLKLASLTETAKRPLFSKSRRAPTPRTQKISVPRFTKKPQKKEPEYNLLGILKNGTRSVALLKEKGTGKYYRVEKGDILGQNKVLDVFVKSIAIEREDGTRANIELKFSK